MTYQFYTLNGTRLRFDPETTEEAAYLDGSWVDTGSTVAGMLVEGNVYLEREKKE